MKQLAVATGRRGHPLVLLMLVAITACDSEGGDENLVARVADYELAVDQAVELLVDEERLAADAGVVRSLAELWIDYTLLAEAAARDTLFEDLDLEPLVLQQVQQQMVFQLRDSVIQVDTFVTEDELRSRYQAEAPEVEVRARHIMLQLPVGATEPQRDSVSSTLQVLRDRIVAGESFASLAREYSQDPGTAGNGGDLGYFRRGEMVAPFETAALALAPGEVSEVVQTPMGFHLIQVEDRRTSSYDEVARQYRAQVQGRMMQEAESVFVSALVDRADPTVAEDAPEIVRGLAEAPAQQLSGRAGRRALVSWESGSLTVGDVREVLQMEAPGLRSQISGGTDEEIQEFLQGLARRDLLVREAEASGLRPAADSVDALVDDARGQLRQAARMLGLLDLDRAPGEALEVAVARAVEGALAGNLSGATQVVPLGMVSFQLREGRSSTVFDAGLGQVVMNVAQIRATRSPSASEGTVGPNTPADTVGR